MDVDVDVEAGVLDEDLTATDGAGADVASDDLAIDVAGADVVFVFPVADVDVAALGVPMASANICGARPIHFQLTFLHCLTSSARGFSFFGRVVGFCLSRK